MFNNFLYEDLRSSKFIHVRLCQVIIDSISNWLEELSVCWIEVHLHALQDAKVQVWT
jgi:hypothetical protein